MFRIDDATAAASLPVPEAAGTEGYWTEGNPATGVPATLERASWFNMIQEELRAIVVAAGLTPNKTTYNQVLTAIQSGLTGHGQCRLSVVSTTSLKLAPYNGNKLIINGASQTIPSAGVTISNSGLSAATVYYVYAYMNSGTMTLELSATTHATNASNGVEIKSGDPTRTLVGMVYVSAAGTFIDNGGNRTCGNWFNRRMVAINSGNINGSTASTTPVAMSGFVPVVMWADSFLNASASGLANNSATAQGFNVELRYDGLSGNATQSQGWSENAGHSYTINSNISASLSEGVHTLQPYANVLGSGTASLNIGIQGTVWI